MCNESHVRSKAGRVVTREMKFVDNIYAFELKQL